MIIDNILFFPKKYITKFYNFLLILQKIGQDAYKTTQEKGKNLMKQPFGSASACADFEASNLITTYLNTLNPATPPPTAPGTTMPIKGLPVTSPTSVTSPSSTSPTSVPVGKSLTVPLPNTDDSDLDEPTTV